MDVLILFCARGAITLDLGAHWLHSADVNPLVAAAENTGYSIVKKIQTEAAHARNVLSTEDYLLCEQAFHWFS